MDIYRILYPTTAEYIYIYIFKVHQNINQNSHFLSYKDYLNTFQRLKSCRVCSLIYHYNKDTTTHLLEWIKLARLIEHT